jgi:signal transduction histidine kinase
MSIRTALILAIVAVAVLATGIPAVIGVVSIDRSIVRGAQSRVDRDLHVVGRQYRRRMEMLAERLAQRRGDVRPGAPDATTELRRLRRELKLDVLNLCDATGASLAGSSSTREARAVVGSDPIIRRALRGEAACGTILLTADRMMFEGGRALCNATAVRDPGAEPVEAAGLFWWMALPVRDSDDRVTAVLYGGRALNHITHELKSPLASIQSMIDTLVAGYAGDVPDKAAHFLVRIKRSCEELQDMVKNYLDLSRAERGELVAEIRAIDLVRDVVEPCVMQTVPLFTSRQVTLDVACPDRLAVEGAPELLRIALTNYLSNAAKYGLEGGAARLVVAA